MQGSRVAEIESTIAQEDLASFITLKWDNFNQQRQQKVKEWDEVKKYLFATDTTTTANQSLPWTHKATVPKLTQIRDLLHANYLSALFPNDKWLTWEAFSEEDAVKEKADTITGYMSNKAREGNLRETVSKLLYDYIDTGNAFAMPEFVTRYKDIEGEKYVDFIGPKAVRISPLDIVFDATANSFEESYKIVRSVSTVGQLKKLAITHPEHKFWEKGLEKRTHKNRAAVQYSADDWSKASQYQVDGFGNLQEYYQSDNVEILEFYGDYYDQETDTLHENRMITIIDRSVVVRNEPIPSYGGRALIRQVGWRFRPDNLWASGPLDNLVGLQYQLDHYHNMGSNALDLKVMAPKKIIGEVEEFNWAPNEEIHIDEGGDVQELAQNYGDIYTVRDWMKDIEERMELYAGAPREAMGVRSPGEKTAFEVQTLDNASSRIFNEKIIQFELFLEEVLNDMLEVAHRNLTIIDIVRIRDNDLGVTSFQDITRDDIAADGVLRPIGARHFAQKANELQGLIGVFNSPVFQMIAPHTSGQKLTSFIEDVIDIRSYDIFRPNVAVEEANETQQLAGQMQEDSMVQAQMSEESLQIEQLQREAQSSENEAV